MAKRQPAPDTKQTRQREFLKALASRRGEPLRHWFYVWAEIAYCSLAKPMATMVQPAHADALEARYLQLYGGLDAEQQKRFPELLGLVVQALDATEGEDFLGPIAAHDEVRALDTGHGQFFTPWSVCQLMAKMVAHDMKGVLDTQPYITMCEPAVGAGAMVLAYIQECREQGINVSRDVWIDATDISSLAYHMAFIQLSVVGAAGVVRRGNALTLDQWEFGCPSLSYEFIAKHSWPYRRADPVGTMPPAVKDAAEARAEQLALFASADEEPAA